MSIKYLENNVTPSLNFSYTPNIIALIKLL